MALIFWFVFNQNRSRCVSPMLPALIALKHIYQPFFRHKPAFS